ncbi:MAG: type II toxin-antitoxin system VapC family toxin [Gemmatimonadaceae bacterium]
MSALLAVLLEEPERRALIAATTGAVLVAPASLPWEVGNALVAGVRRRRLALAEAQAGWAAFETVPIRLVEVDIGQAVALAAEVGLYAYDAYMLLLAQNRSLPIVTLDAKLQAAARRLGLNLVEV